MSRTINIPERTYAAGPQQTSRINLQPGEQRLTVTLTTPSWPAVSDGTITLRFLVDRGQGPVQEWSDTFQHVILMRGGLPQSVINFGAQLDKPFQSGNDFIVQKDSDVSIVTAITVVID